MSKLQEWVNEITGGASLRELGDKLHGNHVTIGRRIAAGDPQTAVDIARAYGANPLEPLVEIGFIRQDELYGFARGIALDEASELELAHAIVRKLEQAQAQGIDSPLQAPIDIDAHRSNTSTGGVGVMPYGAVADSSPDEDALRAAEEGDMD